MLLDNDYWYVIQTHTYASYWDPLPFRTSKIGRICRIPRSLPLQDAVDDRIQIFPLAIHADGGVVTAGHAGSGCLNRGYIYVPVEESFWLPGGVPGVPSQVWVVDPRTMQVVDAMVLEPPFEKAPWCAINDAAGLLYTSHSSGPNAGQIRIYEFTPHEGIRRQPPFRDKPQRLLGILDLRLETGEPFPADEVQAAVVTPNNHLLLICDTPVGTAVSGIHLFDLLTGVRRWHQQFPNEHVTSSWLGLTKLDEAEFLVLPGPWSDSLFAAGFSVKTAFEDDDVKLIRFDTWTREERETL